MDDELKDFKKVPPNNGWWMVEAFGLAVPALLFSAPMADGKPSASW